MKKYISTFTEFLNESAQYKVENGPILTFEKISDPKKHNLVQVTNSSTGKKHRYALLLKGWTSTSDLNFKEIRSEKGGTIILDRYVSGGTSAEKIESDKLKKIAPSLQKGAEASHSEMGVAIIFKPA
jgi:hypothetical protein